MTAVVVVRDLTKRYRSVTALDSVSFTIEENSITGLLGRNGAGKTTVMALLTGQVFRTSGHLAVFGADPVENDAVLSRTCFIKESQRYNEDFKVKHVLAAARIVYSQWDGDFAAQLIEDFSLPLERNIRRLSRGMQSAVGVVVGLASRAPLTFFDEPYLGLDAVARQLFYDRLLADYAENPRTVILSTHLVDEVADLLSNVLLIDHGRVLLDAEADSLRGQAVTVTGPRPAVARVVAGRRQLACERLGEFTRTTVHGRLDESERRAAADAGLSIEPISLQQLMLLTTRESQDGVLGREEISR
jgi:ABC-2 type transport system ATP-binding protein